MTWNFNKHIWWEVNSSEMPFQMDKKTDNVIFLTENIDKDKTKNTMEWSVSIL